MAFKGEVRILEAYCMIRIVLFQIWKEINQDFWMSKLVVYFWNYVLYTTSCWCTNNKKSFLLTTSHYFEWFWICWLSCCLAGAFSSADLLGRPISLYIIQPCASYKKIKEQRKSIRTRNLNFVMSYWEISYSNSYLEPHAFGREILQCQNQKY